MLIDTAGTFSYNEVVSYYRLENEMMETKVWLIPAERGASGCKHLGRIQAEMHSGSVESSVGTGSGETLGRP